MENDKKYTITFTERELDILKYSVSCKLFSTGNMPTMGNEKVNRPMIKKLLNEITAVLEKLQYAKEDE
jgi:hypothetical protein